MKINFPADGVQNKLLNILEEAFSVSLADKHIGTIELVLDDSHNEATVRLAFLNSVQTH